MSNNGLKALLVTSPSRHKNKFWTCSITSPVGSMMPPCDLTSIASVLRHDGIEPKILDIRLFSRPFDTLKDTIKSFKPDALISNMATATAMEDYPILHIAKDLGVARRIVFGFHSMALPEEVFKEGATHILVGDPEYGVSIAVKEGKSERGIWTIDDYSSQPGWIDNLDTLPFPALDLIDVKAYHSLIMGKEPFSILLANRGCPYPCSYCVIPFLFGKKVRTPSVKRIVDEIERDYREFGIRSFFFIDSAINLNPDWTSVFCEELIRRGLQIRWCSNMRVSPISEELLTIMKRSGCFRVFFGVEDLDLINELNRKTTKEATIKAFRLTKEAGIETVAFIILFPGYDNSEKKMASRIIRMVNELKADALQCNIAIPYPGSSIFPEFMQRYNMTRDWSCYDPAGNKPPFPCDIDLLKVRRMVYIGYFLSNPKYVWQTFTRTDIRSLLTFAKNSLKVLLG